MGKLVPNTLQLYPWEDSQVFCAQSEHIRARSFSITYTKINCIGHALGKKADFQLEPRVSIADIMAEEIYKCTEGVSAKDCVPKCRRDEGNKCVMIYLYVISKNVQEAKNKSAQFKKSLEGKDLFKLPIGSNPGLDIHALMGNLDEDDGNCSYTYVPEQMDQIQVGGNQLKYKATTFAPTDEQPDYQFKDPSQILGKWCCCKK